MAAYSSQEYVELCSTLTLHLNGSGLYLQADFRHVLTVNRQVLVQKQRKKLSHTFNGGVVIEDSLPKWRYRMVY
jgi:hypothetical protein